MAVLAFNASEKNPMWEEEDISTLISPSKEMANYTDFHKIGEGASGMVRHFSV